MKRIKTALFLPDWRRGNPYQVLLATGMADHGVEVAFTDFGERNFHLLRAIKRYPTAQVLHLHWIQPYFSSIFWSGNKWKAKARIALMVLDVIAVRALGKRVMWTVHNTISHESPDTEREILARRWLARTVSGLIFHSNEACSEVEQRLKLKLAPRAFIVPHGNYIDTYRPDPQRTEALRSELALDHTHTVIIFFGALRRYKGISQLLEAFRCVDDPTLRLVIAGRPFDIETEQEIQQAANLDPRIRPILGFVPETDVQPLFSIASIAAIPFERTLTSGSAVLAMSMGTALLLPEAAKVIGIAKLEGTIFFQNMDQLKVTLQSLNKHDLAGMGNYNLIAAMQWGWTKIGRLTIDTYAKRLPHFRCRSAPKE